VKLCEDYTYKAGHSFYTIGESLSERLRLRFYYISGGGILGGGTIKDNETLEEAVISRLKREKRI
jgi:hypothetical protein